jgi:hypothetical protein
MVHPTAAARLVAPARGALSLTPGLPRTAAGTVNLAAVAAAADQYLRLAASAQEQPGRRFRRLRRAAAWTPSATGGIMPRHACSAPCGARRRTRAWQFRSAPCLPIGRLSSRHCALDTRHSARGRVRAAGRPVDMWTTQGRCPHPHRRSKRQHQVDCFEGEEVSQVTSPRRLRHLCADRDSHLQSPELSRSARIIEVLVDPAAASAARPFGVWGASIIQQRGPKPAPDPQEHVELRRN